MKDGFVTVYISVDELVEFICDKADLDYNTPAIEMGRPTHRVGDDEIEFPIAFSETGVPPQDWGGEVGKKVEALLDSWVMEDKLNGSN